MCGICGEFTFAGAAQPPRYETLERMCRTIIHRGPDSQGIKIVDGRAGLGMRRLAIIDLSTGDQPMTNEDGTLWIIFNGEIYNYRGLRQEMLRAGHVFRTQSDTEVMLHMYEEYGETFIERCNGMFALCIYDSARQRLYLARDRMGKKPLFYHHAADRFIFGSEIKALLAHGTIPRRVNRDGLADFLTFGFVANPATAFEGIHQLEPAHYLVVESDGRTRKREYWSLEGKRVIRRSLRDAQSEYIELLSASVQDRLISDVPVGLLLSGGIDSGSILAMMSRDNAAVPTFTIRFGDPEKDEGPVARAMANHAGSRHEELFVNTDEAWRILPLLTWHYEQPFGDSSAIPSYYVAQMARKHVTVVLAGDGGDELFGGYYYNLLNVWLRRSRFIPAFLWRLGSKLGEYATQITGRQGPREWLKRMQTASLNAGEFDSAISWLSYTHQQTSRLRNKKNNEGNYDPLAAPRSYWETGNGMSYLNRVLYSCYLRFKLVDDFLVKIDRAMMSNSLEGRSPFLDYRLVEFAASLPDHWKVRGLQTKWFAKKAMTKYLPSEVLRKRKSGFGVPRRKWMAGEFGPRAWEVLLSERALARGYFQPDALLRVRDGSMGSGDNFSLVYHLVMLELWHRLFIDDFSEINLSLEKDRWCDIRVG
ncbi:MAG: Asparagine synthetase [glutamine-hydrolyzing] 1 [Anaerolineales bacterium]|nr:Asparagine synthetase [glutamine-hydrolyzing] 1 [Anaerolineales bacterium]